MSARQTGHYAGTLLPDGYSDALDEANREVRMLKDLVLDEELRNLVGRARDAILLPSTLMRAPVEEAEARFAEAVPLLSAAQAAIAARIREIYLTAALPRT
ncbi:hypothetical protein [Streptomyces zaehneri]|uniref:hypothetical protein n=1 Tax=Streptomyces zaehneri TaxID=3051180 RepID=UPI0028D73875|nr:hypothetical protein [Streptomyces sp. DSM 40713]